MAKATHDEERQSGTAQLSPLPALVPVPVHTTMGLPRVEETRPSRPLRPRPEPREPREQPIAGEGGPSGELALLDVNGSQSIRVRPFGNDGIPNQEAFDQLKEFMRCRRTGQAQEMNPRLVALLTRLAKRFDGAVLHVISAHRAADAVTTRPSSQHTRGTAADVRIPGVSLEQIAQAAHEVGARGIGVYPSSRFVHVDVRDQPYYWRDSGKGPVATRAPL